MTSKVAEQLDGQIESLEERLKKLKNRRTKLSARDRTIKSHREQRDDTRRKILVGAIVLAKIKQKLFDEAVLREWLDKALDREKDRVLFELDGPHSRE